MSALQSVVDVLAPLDRPTMGRLPANVTEITFVVFISQVTRSSTLARQFRDWRIDVLVLSPLQDPEHADRELENALDDVLDAIDAAQPLRWDTAERLVINEQFNAVRVPVIITMQPPIIPKE